MSPREKHISDDARRTSICFTPEDRAAIHWISEIRKGKDDSRTTINDIVVDALWYFLEKTEGLDRAKIQATIPAPPVKVKFQKNVTLMPTKR